MFGNTPVKEQSVRSLLHQQQNHASFLFPFPLKIYFLFISYVFLCYFACWLQFSSLRALASSVAEISWEIPLGIRTLGGHDAMHASPKADRRQQALVRWIGQLPLRN